MGRVSQAESEERREKGNAQYMEINNRRKRLTMRAREGKERVGRGQPVSIRVRGWRGRGRGRSSAIQCYTLML
jgi:hypothetical protein